MTNQTSGITATKMPPGSRIPHQLGADYINESTTPLFSETPTLSNSTLGGLVPSALNNRPAVRLTNPQSPAPQSGAAASGVGGILGARPHQLRVQSRNSNRLTQQVVNTKLQQEFNNENQQQQEGVIGNAVSEGAWGGDSTIHRRW